MMAALLTQIAPLALFLVAATPFLRWWMRHLDDRELARQNPEHLPFTAGPGAFWSEVDGWRMKARQEARR